MSLSEISNSSNGNTNFELLKLLKQKDDEISILNEKIKNNTKYNENITKDKNKLEELNDKLKENINNLKLQI